MFEQQPVARGGKILVGGKDVADFGEVSPGYRGFRLALPNGWEISTRWGTGNYCSERSASLYPISPLWDTDTPEPDGSYALYVEIAAWPLERIAPGSPCSDWWFFGTDYVAGWVDAAKWWAFVEMLSAQRSPAMSDRTCGAFGPGRRPPEVLVIDE